MAIQIPLNDKDGYSEHVAIIDDDDIALVRAMTWHIARRGQKLYAANAQGRYMHRIIMGATNPRYGIDHIDGDGLHNRRANLRYANQQQNLANSGKTLAASSRFKGVSWSKEMKKWEARLAQTVLGYFTTELAAALTYDRAAIHRYGPYARPNFHICSKCGHTEPFAAGAFANPTSEGNDAA